jgi:ligand-binding sensor domain-containing protein
MLRSDSLLYLATDTGLMVQNTIDNSIQHYHMGNSTLNAFSVISLAKQANGTIWIGTDNGLYRIVNGVISRYMATHLKGPIVSMHVDQNNMIWLGVGWGPGVTSFYKINQSETLVSISNPGSSPRAIQSDQNGVLWLGYTDRLLKWNPASGIQVTYTTSNSVLPDNNIKSIKSDSQGNVWILSSLGLTKVTSNDIWSCEGGDFEHPFAGGLMIDVDAQDRVWMVKNTSLLCIEVSSYSTYTATTLGVQGYSLKSVLCDGNVTYGAAGHVGKIVNNTYVVQAIHNTDLLNRGIYKIQTDESSRLWISYGYTSGLGFAQQYSIIDDGQVTHYPLPSDILGGARFVLTGERNFYGLIGNSIYKVTPTGWTYLTYQEWMSQAFYFNGKAYFNPSDNGIYVLYNNEEYNITIDFTGCTNNHAELLTIDNDGRLWFVNSNKLVSYADSIFTVHSSVSNINTVTCISADANGYIWLGNSNGQIWIYNGFSFEEFPTQPITKSIKQIVFGDNGVVWIRTDTSVHAWHELTGFISLIPTLGSNTPLQEIVKMPNDRLLINTYSGYIIYNFLINTSTEDESQLRRSND